MKPYQTMIARDGYEVCLFPLEYLYITQGEYMGPSHYNTYNIDFIGWGANGRIYNCPLYAPCTLKVVGLWGYSGSHTVTFESVEKVHFANGSFDYLTISFTHDNNPPYHTIDEVVPQGQIIYNTGTYGQNISGDHVHITCGIGHYIGYTERSEGHYDLSNRYHLYDALCVNDTTIMEGYNYDWKEYNGPLKREKKKKFPWYIYTNKLNKERSKL